jgi:nucleoside-diphosphate-sugar epimerase
VVFLTGSTGHLGACLLYKLVVVLKVPQVHVLIRTNPENAIAKWKRLMPAHYEAIIGSQSLTFHIGDISSPGLGLSKVSQKGLAGRVTIIINAAANISLKAGLREAVLNNCRSVLSLAGMALSFPRLVSFVQVSSLFALSHLPDGPVEEKLYPIAQVERAYGAILDGGDGSWDGYAWPYARSKHIMECLLTERYPELPLLIVRPSSIGPAVSEPFELYGHLPSIPVDNLLERLMLPGKEIHVFRPAIGSSSGSNVLDEIPVDLVANILLQHVQQGSRGPVHACSRSYVSRTFDDLVSDLAKHVPPYWRSDMKEVVFSCDRPESELATFYRVATRAWEFHHWRSVHLNKCGPLSVDISGHDLDQFTERRVEGILHRVNAAVSRARPKL